MVLFYENADNTLSFRNIIIIVIDLLNDSLIEY